MKRTTTETEAGRQYAAAHEAHYTTKDLSEALELYRDILTAHPETREAEYSRSQIQNIVSSIVPKQELFDAQVELALAHVAHRSPPSVPKDLSSRDVADPPTVAT